jgi:hypothetical protein
MNSISLVGEQPLANLLPIRHYDSRVVYLVHTNDKMRSIKPAENLKHILKAEGRQVELLETDAYNIQLIYSKLSEVIGGDNDFIINLTSGTKPMSIAAHMLASDRKMDYCYLDTSPKKSTIYHYGWTGELQNLLELDLDANISLTDFLTLKNGIMGQGWKLGEVSTPKDRGSWFEKVVFNALKLHFDEIFANVIIGNDVNKVRDIEIDILIRHGVQFVVIELKSGNSGYGEVVRHLHTAGLQLSLFTQKIFAGTNFNKKWDLEGWKSTGIDFLELPSFSEEPPSLSEVDIQSLVSLVSKKLKR